MSFSLNHRKFAGGAVVAIASCMALSSMAAGDVDDRPFDFTDAFYLANGVNPAAIIGRPQPDGVNAVTDNNVPGPEYRNVRLLDHAACWDHSGHITYFHVVGLLFPNTFTASGAGAEARKIAETYKIYEFPRASAPPLSVFPKNQDAVVDLTNGYFSNDPLGAWQVNIVHYTPAAFNTPAGQAALADLAAENGYTLDGTPVIKTLSDIENLLADGLITVVIPPDDGSALRWFMCPIPQDLTDGTIAPDAEVTVTMLDNGLPLPAAAEHVREFHCLQQFGDFCDNPCLADININRVVDVDDLLWVVNSWGPCDVPNCLQDVTGNQQVDVDDLLQVINQWGNCGP